MLYHCFPRRARSVVIGDPLKTISRMPTGFKKTIGLLPDVLADFKLQDNVGFNNEALLDLSFPKDTLSNNC